MQTFGWLCLGQQEIVNEERTRAYLEGCTDGGCAIDFYDFCDCPALADAYTDPATDDAPWYSASSADSQDFLGLLTRRIELSSPVSRNITPRLGEGSSIGGEELSGRLVEAQGWMFASSQAGMRWGEQWLQEALRGRLCVSGCSGDDLSLLLLCDDETRFRSLYGASLVDGPRLSGWNSDDSCVIQEFQFQLATTYPWLFSPVVVAVDDETVAAGTDDCALITTDDWFAGEALTIVVATEADAGASDITITITQSLDGTCPEDRIPASITYVIPNLEPNSSITIDGPRRNVVYAHPTLHADVPGFPYLSFDGPLCYPIVPACSSVCVCARNDSSTEAFTWRVERRARSL